MEIKTIITALAALAQESRLNVFKLLVQAGASGLAAGKIAELAGISPSSLSFHLKELLYADMVNAKQEGRFIIYSANFNTITAVVQHLTENCCGGVPCAPEPNLCCPTLQDK